MQHKRSKSLENIRLISKFELAEVLGVSVATVERWVRVGHLPKPFKPVPGTTARWRVSTIDDWLKQRQRKRYRPTLYGAAKDKAEASQ